MKRWKRGDIVLLQSPEYNVKNCKAEIIDINTNGVTYTFRPLDGTNFDHGNFRRHNQHFSCVGDKWERFVQPNVLPEELFTL